MAPFPSRSVVSVSFVASLVASACTKESMDPSPQGSAATSAAAAASGAPAVGRAPTCTVQPEKRWAENASAAAGISQTDLDSGRFAFGVVVGGVPEVLVFDQTGEGQEKHVVVRKALTEPIAKEKGRREIHRVTAATSPKGEVVLFVDYEQVEKGRRVVSCGPSDSSPELLKFDGKPLVAVADDQIEPSPAKRPDEAPKPGASAAAPPSPAQAKAEAPLPKAAPVRPPVAMEVRRPPQMRELDSTRLEEIKKRRADLLELAHLGERPKGDAPKVAEAPKGVASATKPKGDKVRELRDCRTLVDRGGAHAFTAGSELVGQPEDDGSTEWSMELFVTQELGRGKVVLDASPLGKAPTKLPEFEAPTVLDLGQGEFALTTRHRGSLFAWILDGKKQPRGPRRVFPGGSPGAPRFASLGAESALLVVTHEAGDRVTGHALTFEPGAPQLPALLTELRLGDLRLMGPMSGALSGARRFLAVQADETARRLFVIPVDATLSAAAVGVAVDASVLESRLVPLADGRLLVVYLRSGAGGQVELVSRAIACG